jgi:hypothetical protein
MARLAIKRENFEFNNFSSLEIASMFGNKLDKSVDFIDI